MKRISVPHLAIWRRHAERPVLLATVLGFLAFGGSPTRAEPVTDVTAPCVMTTADRGWLAEATRIWRQAEAGQLKLAPSPLPIMVAIDERCTYTGHADTQDNFQWESQVHGGMATFPDGQSAPIGPISFAAPDKGAAGSGFFAMSLPSVWRNARVTSGLGLERLLDAVLLHEMSHTRQFYFANPELARLSAQFHLPDDISDDSLQQTYAADSDYVMAWQAERDLLFAAAAAPDDVEARRLAAEALTHMRARRAKWFTGEAARWTPLDDLFLTMEGLGQWTAYGWLNDPAGGAMTTAQALPEIRRGGRHWSQDEGLALFLVVDRLLPDWQALAFAERPALAEELLARAVAAGGPSAP